MDGVALLNRNTVYQFNSEGLSTGSGTTRGAPQVPFAPPYVR